MSHLSKRNASAKPAVPDGFPLWWHAASGRWCRKCRGKFCYFPPDPDEALAQWLDQRDELLAGRVPRGKAGLLTVVKLADEFLIHKKALLDSGEITQRSFKRYSDTAHALVNQLGRDLPVEQITVRDLEQLRAAFAKRWGVVCLGNELAVVRSIFKYGFDAGLMDRPVRTGSALRRPPARLLRANRAKTLRMFEAHELVAVLNRATPVMRAMIYLGVNCGYGNADVAGLTVPQVEKGIRTGWLDVPRGKTGVARRCPLWPETRQALQAALDARPQPQDEQGATMAFLGRHGEAIDPDRRGSELAARFRRTVERAGVHRPGLNFYALRHTTQTIGETAGDLVALDAILGHVAPQTDMRSTYRERIDDGRLQRVADAIRQWLLTPPRAEGDGAVVPFQSQTA